MQVQAEFFHHLALTDLTLRVGDLDTVATFYRDLLGFREVATGTESITLSPTGAKPRLIVLEAAPRAPRRPAGTAGLFHAAFLVPDRAALGRIARRLRENEIPLGAADHGVSETLYLQDPEGNGIEWYVDRPPSAWPPAHTPGQVAMVTEPLDLDSLLAEGDASTGPALPPDTRMGHVHLSVSDLRPARAFYGDVLGFPVRQQDYPGALFLGRDGYHHHLAVNTWRSQRAMTPGARGLAHFTLRFSDTAERQRVIERARATGHTHGESAAGVIVRDADGIELRIAAE